MSKIKNPEQPETAEPKTLNKVQFLKALESFRKHCYRTYCQDCEYKGKNHAILTCYERYMLEEVYR